MFHQNVRGTSKYSLYHSQLLSLYRSKSIEPDVKFEKVANRIAMFEGYIDETSRMQSPVVPRRRTQTPIKNLEEETSLPPPRPPPPTDYINDAFRTSNYFSLPRNSRIICSSDDDLSVPSSETKNATVYKSSSFSNFPRVAMPEKDIVAGMVHQTNRQNKLMNCIAPFTSTNPTPDQQKNAGRIIG